MTNTVSLHYSEAGQGTPVVLLHGFPLSSAIWHEQRQALSADFRVITPDLRGHGQSPAPAGVYEMSLLAQDVLALLDQLKIEQAVLIGHSMGGYVTLAAWRLAPERFRALGWVASQAGADTEAGRQGRHQLAEKVASEGSKAVASAMLPKLFAPGLPGESPVVEQVRQLILQSPPAGIIGSLQGLAARPDSVPLLPQIKVPTLVIAGDSDQVIPAEKATALAAGLPQATLATIEHAGHMPMLEQPQATTGALRTFLHTLGK